MSVVSIDSLFLQNTQITEQDDLVIIDTPLNQSDIDEITAAVLPYDRAVINCHIHGIEDRYTYLSLGQQWSTVWGNLYDLKNFVDQHPGISWMIHCEDCALTMAQRVIIPIFYQQQEMPITMASTGVPVPYNYSSVPMGRRKRWHSQDPALFRSEHRNLLKQMLADHDEKYGKAHRWEFPEFD